MYLYVDSFFVKNADLKKLDHIIDDLVKKNRNMMFMVLFKFDGKIVEEFFYAFPMRKGIKINKFSCQDEC